MARTTPSALSHDVASLLLRLAFGGLMIVNHGVGKWERLTGTEELRFADPLGVGVKLSLQLATGAELVCASFVVLGLFLRLNLVPLLFTMVVAVFVVHSEDPLARKEMGLLYLMAYLALFLLGPGRLSGSEALSRAWSPKSPVLRWLVR